MSQLPGTYKEPACTNVRIICRVQETNAARQSLWILRI